MANRVLLDASGLKVSRPGLNVLTAANHQLAFSSEWQGLKIYGRYTFTVASTYGSGTQTYRADTSVPQLFDSTPLTFIAAKLPGASGFSAFGVNRLTLTRPFKNDGALAQEEMQLIASRNGIVRVSLFNQNVTTEPRRFAGLIVSYIIWDLL